MKANARLDLAVRAPGNQLIKINGGEDTRS
jgi:hypothetical protein